MVVKGHDVDLPEKFVLRAMVDGDGEITSVVEKSKFGNGNLSSV